MKKIIIKENLAKWSLSTKQFFRAAGASGLFFLVVDSERCFLRRVFQVEGAAAAGAGGGGGAEGWK